MNFRKIFGYCVLTITILSVNLLTGAISNYMMHFKGTTDALKFTAIGMAVLVIILFPAFKYLDALVTSLARKMLSKGHHMFGRVLGTLIAFFIILFILYCFYAKIWFCINVPRLLIKYILP